MGSDRWLRSRRVTDSRPSPFQFDSDSHLRHSSWNFGVSGVGYLAVVRPCRLSSCTARCERYTAHPSDQSRNDEETRGWDSP